jgi:hypothetical protein
MAAHRDQAGPANCQEVFPVEHAMISQAASTGTPLTGKTAPARVVLHEKQLGSVFVCLRFVAGKWNSSSIHSALAKPEKLSMSRSGSSNFDSDAASDYVGDLVQRLVKEVEQALARPTSTEPDEYYGNVLPCIVEIIAALHQLSGTAALPPPEVIADWRSKFLAVRNRALGGASAAIDPRRRAIRGAFDKLQELSRIVHEDLN